MHEPIKKYSSSAVGSDAHSSNVQESIDVPPEMKRRGVDRQISLAEVNGQHHLPADSLNVSEETVMLVNRRHHRLPAQMLEPLVEDAEEEDEDVVVDGMDEDVTEHHQHQTQTFAVADDAENDDTLIDHATVGEDGRKSGHKNIIVDDNNDEETDSVDFFWNFTFFEILTFEN